MEAVVKSASWQRKENVFLNIKFNGIVKGHCKRFHTFTVLCSILSIQVLCKARVKDNSIIVI